MLELHTEDHHCDTHLKLFACLIRTGGFGSYLFGMSSKIANQTTEANDSQNIKDPKLGWMIGFMFVVSFLGLFSLVPLREVSPNPAINCV